MPAVRPALDCRPMSSRIARFCRVGLLLSALGPLAVLAHPVVTWAVVEGPPEHENPQAQRVQDLGQGPMDQQLRLLAQALPQFEHRIQAMSLERVWRDMRQGRALCFADAFKTRERRAVAHFVELGMGTPMLVVAAPGRLPPGTEVSLRALLEEGRLKGLFVRQRSYGEALDELLAAFSQPREALPDDQRLLAMLEQGRMDYVLETPNGWLQTVGLAVETRRVREAREPPPVHVACGRGMSRRQMREIDAAVRRLSREPAWLQMKLLAYPPAAREAMRPVVEQYLRERAAQGERIE
jgi:uncharacterized protein (TIGR02285 family)